jgi:hypothetical protein
MSLGPVEKSMVSGEPTNMMFLGPVEKSMVSGEPMNITI